MFYRRIYYLQIVLFLLFVVSMLCLSACESTMPPPTAAIVGKWRLVKGIDSDLGNTERIVEFLKNGTVTVSTKTTFVSGTYTFLDPYTLSIQWNETTGTFTQITTVHVLDNKLRFQTRNGNVSEFIRVEAKP